MIFNNAKNIRNIIFDLGGVILNIDYNKTEQAFIKLGIKNFNELFNQFHANSFFKDLETGTTDPGKFVAELKTYAPGLSETEIINAWNAMLLDFPPGRITFLLALKKKYRTFLLSNTNAIHHKEFQKIKLDVAGSLDECFEKTYYSHEIGKRKPGKEIFEFVLEENGLITEETLFLDDTPANVETAKSLDMETIFVRPGERIEDLLSDLL